MELQITLDVLIAWHQRRAQDCIDIMARATHTPKREREALMAIAEFHQAAVRLLKTYQL